MKRCYKCGETKTRSEFHKNRSRKDGAHDECKACVNEYEKKRYAEGRTWLQQNPYEWRRTQMMYDQRRRSAARVQASDDLWPETNNEEER